MTNTERKPPQISAAQLFCMLMLSRLSAEIAFPLSGTGYGGETLLALVIAEVIRFLLALPLIIYSAKGNNFYRAAYRKNKFIGWASAGIAFLLLAGAGVKSLFHTAVFAQRCLLPKGSPVVLTLIVAGFAVYAAVMGAEALARSGTLFLVAAAIITAAVMLADIPYMKFEAMDFSQSQYGGLIDDIIERLLRGGDYLIFAALLPFVASKKEKRRLNACGASLFFALFSTLAGVLLCAFYCLTLREFYGMTEYPFFAAASLSDIALLKRLDGGGAALWTLCAAFRTGLMLFAAWSVISQLVGEVRGKTASASDNAKEQGSATAE